MGDIDTRWSCDPSPRASVQRRTQKSEWSDSPSLTSPGSKNYLQTIWDKVKLFASFAFAQQRYSLIHSHMRYH